MTDIGTVAVLAVLSVLAAFLLTYNRPPRADSTDPRETASVPLRGVFPRDNRSGNNLSLIGRTNTEVSGILTPAVVEGDRFGYEMGSGRVRVFEIHDIKRYGTHGLFIAGARPLGDADELGYYIDPPEVPA